MANPRDLKALHSRLVCWFFHFPRLRLEFENLTRLFFPGSDSEVERGDNSSVERTRRRDAEHGEVDSAQLLTMGGNVKWFVAASISIYTIVIVTQTLIHSDEGHADFLPARSDAQDVRTAEVE